MWSIAVKAILGVLLSIGLDKIIKNFTGGNDKPKRIATPRKGSTSQPKTGMSTTTKVLLGVGAVGVAYVGWRSWQVSQVYDNSDKLEVQQALQLNEALADSGGFLSNILMPLVSVVAAPAAAIKQLIDAARAGGTSAIVEIGKQIQDFAAVEKWYNQLSGGSLKKDLANKLSKEDLDQFYNSTQFATKENSNAPTAVAGNKNVPTNLTKTKYGNLIFSKSDKLYLRAQPQTKSGLLSYFNKPEWTDSNVLATIPNGGFVGFATGREEYNKDQNVYMVEVAVKFGAPYLNNLPQYYNGYVSERYKNNLDAPIVYGWVYRGGINYFNTFDDAKKIYKNLPALDAPQKITNGIGLPILRVKKAIVFMPDKYGLNGIPPVATINGIPVPINLKRK